MTQTPAAELAALRKRQPNESIAYGEARRDLLAAEIDLQRNIDRVSETRRSLPDGPLIEKDYRFKDMNGSDVGFVDLFGEHDTLIIYFWMYGVDFH